MIGRESANGSVCFWARIVLKQSAKSLFNPEEKEQLYKTQDLGLEFARSVCMKTYGSWLLMRDPLNNLYILNLFTQQRINLPPSESQLGKTKMERRRYGLRIRSPVFWIDEKTKHYIVFWRLGSKCVVYTKKGDTSWFQIPKTSGCRDLVYKDHTLYFLSKSDHCFKIVDFSGEIPQETFQRSVTVRSLSQNFRLLETKLVVTVTGEVLMVEKCSTSLSNRWAFRVSKVYSSGLHNRHKPIYSLGDELMLLDQGITVLANDTDGFVRNSIYFSATREANRHCIFLYDLETGKTERLHKINSSSVQFSSAQWFLPVKSDVHTKMNFY
ncbi:unnamed protein product [Thlaspi arvense]|uniref:KIB1-4 beta-propeller domain-containing protein n=1 Tax=Thlaspi arvense TaxID=13288 RepID=A0AAU9T262_THLAR|nr:unnamed protein product [Thlaspi arvense]